MKQPKKKEFFQEQGIEKIFQEQIIELLILTN